MNIKVVDEINKDEIIKRVVSAKDRAIALTASEFARLCEPYVPYDTGTMSNSVSKSPFNKGLIVYDTDYAKAVYNKDNKATNWTRDHHPQAMSGWADYVKVKYKDRIESVFNKALKGSI